LSHGKQLADLFPAQNSKLVGECMDEREVAFLENDGFVGDDWRHSVLVSELRMFDYPVAQRVVSILDKFPGICYNRL